MPINFHPEPGTILICDYGSGFIVPEMVKARPVVVISPRFRHRTGLCAVVPLSSTEPEPILPYHHQLAPGAYPPARGPMWAKCDMVASVSLGRLDRVKIRPQGGARQYVTYQMPAADLAAILQGVKAALGLP